MSDLAVDPRSGRSLGKTRDWASTEAQRSVKRRYGADLRLQIYGLIAVCLTVLLLGIFLGSIIATAWTAFRQTHVTLTVPLDAAVIDRADPGAANYRKLANDAIKALLPDVPQSDQNALQKMFSTEIRYAIRDKVVANPGLIGQTISFDAPLSDTFDQLYKGVIPRRVLALNERDIERFERLFKSTGHIAVQDGRTIMKLDVLVNPGPVKPDDLAGGDYLGLIRDAIAAFAPDPRDADQSMVMVAPQAADQLKAYILATPAISGTVIKGFAIPVAPNFDALNRGTPPMVVNPRFNGEKQFGWLDQLRQKGLLSSPLNWNLLTNADSRFPELAGLKGGLVGTALLLLVGLIISFPTGIAAAIYLEEFAPKNRWTDLIEVNINNLAAVPSVVFGLLGLALFLNIFGLPRSSPLVGGMVMSLIMLPTIIIATRNSLKAVPPSIRQAALGVGASKHQVVMHHVLPLAMPGIMTGTIIGVAHALGETAPLLLIGMNAFITSASTGLLDPATTMPTQIYTWADSPERGFVAKTSAAIIILLGFLVVMNGIAVYLRQKFERRWS